MALIVEVLLSMGTPIECALEDVWPIFDKIEYDFTYNRTEMPLTSPFVQ